MAGELAAVLDQLAGELGPLRAAVAKLAEKAAGGSPSSGGEKKEFDPKAEAQRRVERAERERQVKAEMGRLGHPAGKPPPGKGSPPPPGAGMGGLLGGARMFSGFTGALGNLTAGIGLVGKAFGPVGAAVAGAVTAIAGIPGAVKPFVEAFNPKVLETYQTAMRDLSATVGQAFAPVFERLIPVVRQVSDILAGSFERLRPVVDAITQAVGNFLLPAVRLVADVFDVLMRAVQPMGAALGGALAGVSAGLEMVRAVVQVVGAVAGALQTFLRPLFQINAGVWEVLTAVVQQLAAVFKVLGAVVSAAFDVLGSLMPSTAGLRGAFTQVADAVRHATKAFVLFSARMMKLIGFDSGVRRLVEAFSPTRGGTRKLAAPTDFGITGIEDVFRQAQVAAAQAAAGGERSTEEWLAEIAEELKAIEAGRDAGMARLEKSLGPIVFWLGEGVKLVTGIHDFIVKGARRLTPGFERGDRGRSALDFLTGGAFGARRELGG